MPVQNRNTLKSYFNTGDRPTERQLADTIDSTVNIADDKANAAYIDIHNDDLYVTPKSVKKIIDTYTVRQVNNVTPDPNGNVQVTDISGRAHSITGSILKGQVTGLQADLDNKVQSDTLKTINNQSLIGPGNIDITGGGGSGSLSAIAIPANPYTIPGTASPNAFPPACDTFTLQANKIYFFRGKYLIENGTSHTIAMGWSISGLAVTSMEYVAELFSSNLNAFATSSTRTQISGIGLKVLNSSTASPTTTIEFEGTLRCTTGGTISPVISFSTPSMTPLSIMKAGSFIEFTEVGNHGVQAFGAVN